MTPPIDISYTIDMKDQSAQLTAHTDKGKEFLADRLPTGKCWVYRLRTDSNTGYIQMAKGRGLVVAESGSYRFDGKHVKELASDHEAFEEANGYHDERSATVEKMIYGRWCPAADPVYQPEFFRGSKDGGWIVGDGRLIALS